MANVVNFKLSERYDLIIRTKLQIEFRSNGLKAMKRNYPQLLQNALQKNSPNLGLGKSRKIADKPFAAPRAQT